MAGVPLVASFSGWRRDTSSSKLLRELGGYCVWFRTDGMVGRREVKAAATLLGQTFANVQWLIAAAIIGHIGTTKGRGDKWSVAGRIILGYVAVIEL